MLLDRTEPRLDLHSASFHYVSSTQVKWFEQIEQEREMSLLRTSSLGPEEEEAFLRILESILSTAQGKRESQICRELVEAWFSLLISKREPSHNAIVGLMGELLAILKMSDPERAITEWRWRDDESLDFVSVDVAMEVKTSATGLRHHKTSFLQDSAAMRKPSILISILVAERIDGANIPHLQEKIQEFLPTGSSARVELAAAIIRRVGVSDLVNETKIDMDAAIRSVQIFRWTDLPRPIFPAGISNAEWTFEVPEEKAKLFEAIDMESPALRTWLIP